MENTGTTQTTETPADTTIETPNPSEASTQAGEQVNQPNEPVVKHKIKVNGKEEELPLDEIIKLAQHGKLGQKTAREAAEFKKQFELERQGRNQLLKQLQSLGLIDDKGSIRNLNELLSDHVKRTQEESKLTPEQKELRALKAQLAEREAKDKAAKDREAQTQLQQYAQQFEQEITQDIVTTLQGSKLPKTADVIERFVYFMEAAFDKGKKDVKAKDVLPFVEESFITRQKYLFDTTEESELEKLIDVIGIDSVEKLVAAYTKKKNPVKQDGNTLEKPIVVEGKKSNSKPNKNNKKKSPSFNDWKYGRA